MIELQAAKIARNFGAELLFEDISLQIQTHDRVGLLGRNGTGKSTILKILAGIEKPDAGQVSLARDKQVGYLDQYALQKSHRTIWDEMLPCFDKERGLLAAHDRTAQKIASSSTMVDEALYQELLMELDSLQQQIDLTDAYNYEAEIKIVLNGFRFFQEDYDRSITTLSGGQQTRLALAKLLLQKPDILILDEPTNHLDIETLAWLENYLITRRTTLIVVSHDQYFLDKICTKIYELSPNHLEFYNGNYSFYLKERVTRYETRLKAFDKQQKEIAKLEDFVAKNIVRASTTKRAQSRRKQLEKMDRLERPKQNKRDMHLQFSTIEDSGKDVLSLQDLSIGYDHPLATDIELELTRQEAIAIVGPNGIGKSTLLKTILGKIPPIYGEIRVGTKVSFGYYDQQQQSLTAKKTILAELWDGHPTLPEEAIRTLLGSFLFSGEDVLKTIGQLSGGERARVSLAKLALDHDNTLLLDEPTNHLDIDSKEVLEDALQSFDGTLLFVSHDRFFINQIATSILELDGTSSRLYPGDFDYYQEKKAEEKAIAELLEEEKAKNNPISDTTLTTNEQDFQDQKKKARAERQLKRRLASVEEALEAIQTEKTAIHLDLENPDTYTDAEKMKSLQADLSTLDKKEAQLEEEWTTIGMELEEWQ